MNTNSSEWKWNSSTLAVNRNRTTTAGGYVVSDSVSAFSRCKTASDIMIGNVIAYGYTTYTYIGLILKEGIKNTWLLKESPWMALYIVIVYSWGPNV